MKNLTWQNPEQLFVAQVLINKVKSKCCGIKDYEILGAESIWFSLLIDYGIMGGLMFIFLVLVCCFLIYKCQKTAVLFPVIYFVFLSLSAPIDENINILMTFVVIFLRMDYWSRDSELKWCNIVISSTHR